jgi:hypothetical protein
MNCFLERDFQDGSGADLRDKNHRKPLQFKGRRQEMIFGGFPKTAGYSQKERYFYALTASKPYDCCSCEILTLSCRGFRGKTHHPELPGRQSLNC